MASPEAATIRVLFDATRLLARGGLATPTGIDRVDFAYVSALSTAPGIDLQLVTFDVFGPKLLGQGPATRLIDAVRQRWEGGSPADLPQAGFRQLREWLEAPAGTARPVPAKARGETTSEGTRLRRAGSALNGALGSLRPRRIMVEGSAGVYVNTSHGRLFRKAVSRWLGHTGIGGVFFIHDLIPLEFPEFNRPREPARHASRLETVGAHARQVIVNSNATRSALTRYLQKHNQRVPPIDVLHLGVEDRFGSSRNYTPLSPTVPYFVMLSTIEPRKNHQLLLQVWRRLVESEGNAAPRLVLIGRRGWENQTVFNILDRSSLLSCFVVEGSGLGDGDIATLLRGARALLMPSFGEGFGLPVAEALALGTPVIASAIAAHREVGGDSAEYLDPLDGLGWLQAVRDYSAMPSPRREKQLQRLGAYKPPSWEKHLSSTLNLIRAAAYQTSP
ncbi:MAG: glycosyltransferase family 1 protein [Nevskia sp.]|nr:glycosyltransferase family 1 protein [Nevskia sp.]